MANVRIEAETKELHRRILTGHLHFGFESRLPGGTIQYVTNRGDRGNAREITVI